MIPFVNTSIARLRAWLDARGIPDCDCGYMWVQSESEAHHLTGGRRSCESYPGWILTTIDLGCRHHGDRTLP